MIAEHGYAGTSLARIAEAAGLSNAAVLYHFGSKNAVLESAYAKVIGDLAESVWTAMSGAPSAKDSIDAYVRALVGFMLSHPTYLRLMIEVLTTSDLGQPGQPPEPDSSTPPRWAPLADAMARAQTDGDFRSFDTRTYAIALGGALDGISPNHFPIPGTTSIGPLTIYSTFSTAPPSPESANSDKSDISGFSLSMFTQHCAEISVGKGLIDGVLDRSALGLRE